MSEKLVTIRLPQSDVDMLIQACAIAAEYHTRRWRSDPVQNVLHKQRAADQEALKAKLVEAIR